MKRNVRCDPGAVLLLGLLLFSLTIREVAALFTAAVILYHQPEEKWKVVFCALSGPFLGLLLFCALRHAWTDCAEISLLLSIINLLPVLPLDGGRALNALLVGQIRFVIPVFGFLIPFSFMMTGLVLTYQKQGGSGLLMFGSWLLILTCQEPRFDVK